MGIIILAVLALACNLPFLSSLPNQATQAALEATSLAQIVHSTLLAQSAASTAAAQALNATGLAQLAETTATAQAAAATALALAANATADAQSAAATQQAESASATAAALAATATAQANLPPTRTPLPPTPVGERITFAPGATSANREGTLRKGASVDYYLRAQASQIMMLAVYSPHDNVYLGVVGMGDGIPLLRPSARQTQFTVKLPATQDYRITLESPNEKTNYTLQVIIPARIKFAPSAISTSVNGSLGGHETNYYLVRAFAGQKMTVKINSPGHNIFLTIYGLDDGIPLVRSVSASTEWSGILPGTQDYMIEAVNTGAASNYTLSVKIQ
jgi:hypothetical protein